MARRYGGKYSPDASEKDARQPQKNRWADKRRTRAGGRVNLLFFVPLPLIFTAFSRPPAEMATDLLGLGLLLLAAWLTREGVVAQETYEARTVARRPAIPRKMFASVLTGAGLFAAGFAPGVSILTPALFALLGIVLHFLSFGPDPLKNKGMEGIDTFQTDRVARAVDEAEKHLAAMSDAIRRAGDRSLERRVEEFQSTARDMFRTVENDPRDLTAARKYLSVYLMGARDATSKFADIYARRPDPQVRADYESLLDDLERNFAARTETMLLDDRSDLTVEIDVLKERLAREGVRTE